MIGPLRFEPFLRPMVWGGRRLRESLGKPLPDAQPYGESWEVSDHPSFVSRVAAGPLRGTSLRELMTARREALLGAAAPRYPNFPWLIKFLDAHDRLSVQVHPDGEAVRRLWPGEGSKTEAWFILDAAPGAVIYAGLKEGIGEAAMRGAIAAGAVADCLHRFEPKAGDCVFLPAGTVHALGGGILLAEVQQTSDATFRLFDWNRVDATGKPRSLHIDEALAAIHWDQGPVRPVAVADYSSPNDKTVALVECPYFALEYRQASRATGWEEPRLQALIAVRGSGRLRTENTETDIAKGDVWLKPACVRAIEVLPDETLGIVVSTLP